MAFLLTFLAGPIGRWVLVAVLVAASYGAAYWKGRMAGYASRDKEFAQAQAESDRLSAVLAGRRQAITERVVVKYRDRIKVVKEKGEEVIREVEKLVPADSCELPGGWRVLHDAASAGQLPDAAGRAPAAPVAAQEAARTVAENYAICLADQRRLEALQEWAVDQANAPEEK